MGREPLAGGAISARVSQILNAELGDGSLRGLSRASGIKLTRLGDVLRRGGVITVQELDDIAAALGLVGWRVMKDAEMGAPPRLQVFPDMPPTEQYGETAPTDIPMAAQEGDVEAEQEGSQETP